MKNRRHHIKKNIRRLKPKKPFFKKSSFWLIILFLIIASSFFYLLVFFSKLQVSSIIVLGNNNVQSEALQKIAWNNINKKIITLGNWKLISKSIFLTGPKTIEKNVLDKFSQIENVKVSKKFPQTITIQVNERTPFAIFCQTDDRSCFYIDENGIIFEVLEQIPKNISVIRQLIDDKDVFTGEKVIEKKIIDTISNIKRNLEDNFQIDVKSAIISTPLRLNIETSENWQIYFNLDSETDLQIAKMNLLLKDEISESNRKALQYIDLRFKARAFYK